jgi:hypothetical protein
MVEVLIMKKRPVRHSEKDCFFFLVESDSHKMGDKRG